MGDFIQHNSSHCNFTSNNSWVVLSSIEQSIKHKIEAVGTPLKDWNIQINYGIKTGCNEAFIINGNKREEILNACITEDERIATNELIRPILRGRDIKRYGYDFADLWLIATFPSKHYDIDQFPALKDYLLSFGKYRLEQTGKTYFIDNKKIISRKKTNNKWFETQDSINYWEDFFKPKVIWKRVGSKLKFSYDESNSLALDSTCFATGTNLKYLCCVLNSNMGHYLLQNAPKTGTGDLLISVQAVEPIKIPIISQSEQIVFDNILNNQIVNYTDTNIKIIDDLVYSLYKLSSEEIEFINMSTTQFV